MRILITAGPTREAIDPVRYISNRSSGKMGYSIAQAAVAKGHQVVLISGPVKITPPAGVEFVDVETAREMFEAVKSAIKQCDAAVFCAAVSDYRVAQVATEKIKKTADELTLTLEKTEDILGSCRSTFGFTGILMGFAAETQNVEQNARAKLSSKGCDFLVANDVSRTDIGFDQDRNEVTVYGADGSYKTLPIQEKRAIGETLIQFLENAECNR
ncbi:MAG: phosphopantothenoylcysteine decarboxylase [Verrucomicrobiales bacterium]|nr:phosphopantothenoylcysteine decarboxylase [Verrucomicrobiales bacterium]